MCKSILSTNRSIINGPSDRSMELSGAYGILCAPCPCLLIVLREKYKDEGSVEEEITLNISRMDLANMAGIAKDNLNRLLKSLRLKESLKSMAVRYGSGILNGCLKIKLQVGRSGIRNNRTL
jgi:hypothetical protein